MINDIMTGWVFDIRSVAIHGIDGFVVLIGCLWSELAEEESL